MLINRQNSNPSEDLSGYMFIQNSAQMPSALRGILPGQKESFLNMALRKYQKSLTYDGCPLDDAECSPPDLVAKTKLFSGAPDLHYSVCSRHRVSDYKKISLRTLTANHKISGQLI